MTVNNTIDCERLIVDDMTADLLEIADLLEEHRVNVELENGRYLNPASAIRSKVDKIDEAVLAIVACKRMADDDRDR